MATRDACPLGRGPALAKRTFDVALAAVGLIATAPVILVAAALATLDTRRPGLFTQVRVGRGGRPFRVIKIRTMRDDPRLRTTVTVDDDRRITRLGRLLRRTKIDELPQLINVLAGQMSFVGPRPDVPGFADELRGADRIVLAVRPGITGPATLKYRDEERMLGEHDDPEEFNRRVVFPDKVRLNRQYVERYRFVNDLRYLLWTVFGQAPEHTEDGGAPHARLPAGHDAPRG